MNAHRRTQVTFERDNPHRPVSGSATAHRRASLKRRAARFERRQHTETLRDLIEDVA